MEMTTAAMWITSVAAMLLEGSRCGEWWIMLELVCRLFGMICNLEGILDFAAWYFEPLGTIVRERDKRRRKKKKLYRRKEVWYRRRQRRLERERWERWKRNLYPWDGSHKEWVDDWFRSNRHYFLHVLHYGAKYEQWLKELNGMTFNPIVETDQLLCSRHIHSTDRESYGFIATDKPLCEVKERENIMEQLPETFHQVCFVDSDHLKIVLDTGATISVTPFRDDFIDWEQGTTPKLSGITADAEVCGVGTVLWKIRDDHGMVQEVRTRAYYVPQAQIRLFSPQSYFLEQTDKSKSMYMMNADGFAFVFGNGACRTMQWKDQQSRLPTVSLPNDREPTSPKDEKTAFNIGVLNDANHNIDNSQKTLLKSHWKMSHIGLSTVQALYRSRNGEEPVLSSPHKRVNTCDLPKCASCEYAKAHRQPKKYHKTTERAKKRHILSHDTLRPGQLFSVDQFESRVPGRLATSKGKEKDALKYRGGTIFYDHASGYMHVRMQVSFDAASTLAAKHSVEQECMFNGIDVIAYRADQGIFKSADFRKDLEKKGQTIDFSAVGAHHQNGAAERAIRTISDLARANLLHARLHWPTKTDLDLWPMAVEYAVYIYNNTPKESSGLAPIEIWSGMKSDYNALRSAHVWGCPCYVLEPKLQDGKKIPKWQPRSRRGQFLGRSLRHASSAALIRNLKTGSISTQFHCVFDDWFTTVSSNDAIDRESEPKEWIEILITSREKLTEDEDEAPPLSDEWLTDEEKLVKERYRRQRERRANKVPLVGRRQHRPDNIEVQENIEEEEVVEDNNEAEEAEEPNIVIDNDNDDGDESEGVESDHEAAAPAPPRRELPPRRLRRPRRWFDETTVRPNNLYQNVPQGRQVDNDWTNLVRSAEREFGLLNEEQSFLATLDNFMNESKHATAEWKVHQALIMSNTDADGLLHSLHPLALSAKANSEDAPNFYQAMNGPDAEGWLEAMDKEIQQLLEKDPWDVVPIEQARGKNILDCTWALVRKRFPDGRVRKLKARWCVRGDQQIEGVDFFDTYAPVVAWSTVRLLLILTVTLSLKTKQVDFTLGFIHALLDDEVYVQMPKLYEKPGHVLKLKRSIYGLRQSPKNFFKRVSDGMEIRGFKQHLDLDPCLFISKSVVCLCYVDDLLYFGRSESAIDKAIEELGKDFPDSPGFDVRIEDDVAGYLGIYMKKNADGTIELLQTGLIDRILMAMGLENAKAIGTPATKEPLIKDEFGETCSETWSYASVVGMMMYLASNSRPDIAFAVHAAARHTHHPKRIHEVAVKRIARYLKGTRDRGMLIRPTTNCQLDLFVDADFAGLWNVQEANDPVTLRSRSGFVATLGGNPILWGSKLQTEISLSTTEAEYIAASMAMRSFIPLKRVVNCLLGNFEIQIPEENEISMVWEDNNGVIKMVEAEYPNMTPRTKHIAIKYHWFREHVDEKIDGTTVRMKRIDTGDQLADIFTKGILGEDFRKKRKLLIGW